MLCRLDKGDARQSANRLSGLSFRHAPADPDHLLPEQVAQTSRSMTMGERRVPDTVKFGRLLSATCSRLPEEAEWHRGIEINPFGTPELPE